MFKNWELKDLKFYYNDNVNTDEYPTFIHWILAMREQGNY